MALAIATNNAALQAAASASSVNRDMETSMARLSTGKRINSARDDAAGVAIASRLSSEIRGTDQAIRNAMDGQALIDTAEGGHSEIENVLQRMREVAVQSANDTNDLSDRQNLQAEIKALVTEIDRIASVTTWAGQTMMSDIGSKFTFQVGTATGDKNQIGIDIKAMSKTALGISGGATAGAINPISSGIGIVGDSTTGMLTLDQRLATGSNYSAMVENTALAVTNYTPTTISSMSDVAYTAKPTGTPTAAAAVAGGQNGFTAAAAGKNSTITIGSTVFTADAHERNTTVVAGANVGTTTAVNGDAFTATAANLASTITIAGVTINIAAATQATTVINTAFETAINGHATLTAMNITATANAGNTSVKLTFGEPLTYGANVAIGTVSANTPAVEHFKAAAANLASTITIDGTEFTTVAGTKAVDVIAAELVALINSTSTVEGKAMVARGITAAVVGTGAAAEVKLTYGTPPALTVSELNASYVTQINASSAMDTRGITAAVVLANADDLVGEVKLTFTGPGKAQRDTNAKEFAAAINNDPSFLAKGIIAVAQTDAAVLGSTKNGGSEAQSLVFTGSASMAGARWEIKGTDANGIPMSEMVIGTSSSNKTVQDFLTVESITQIGDTDVASNISIGTASDTDGVLSATNTSAGNINFGTAAVNTMVNARVELLHGADDMSTAAKARHAVTVLDGAIKSVNTQRSNLGAISNRLSHTVSNLTNISSNLSAAKGGIEDADFALETTALAKNQILQQASTAMLAQANAAKQNVLSLLQG